MYLPPGAPERLLRGVASLMAPGSRIAGDTLINSLSLADQTFVRELGTKWTFEFASEEALCAELVRVGFRDCTVVTVDPFVQSSEGEADPKDPEAIARRLQTIILSIAAWPRAAAESLLPELCKGNVEPLVQLVVQDKMNFQVRCPPLPGLFFFFEATAHPLGADVPLSVGLA